jgi:uncharacterized Zn finger protein
MLGDMTTSDLEFVLRNLAGDGAFERGLAYFESKKVVELETEGTKTIARVEGAHVYAVTLHRTPRGLDGTCDCPASDGIEFCKHCVAVALMLGAAQNLPELHQRLSLRAAAALGQINLKSLKKEITAASPLRDIWRRQEAHQYFARFENVLAGIADVAVDLPAKDLLTLVMHAVSRLDKALERVDDSNGDRWGVQQKIHDLNIIALSGLEWDMPQRAGHLLDSVLADSYDLYTGFEQIYAQLLGESGWLAFYRQARKRLEALPPLEFGSNFSEAYPHQQLGHLLTSWHRSNGDITQTIEVLKLTCATPHDCHEIAALYLQQGKLELCGDWLAKGDAQLSDQQRITPLHVAYAEASGDLDRALVTQQQWYQDQPSYARLAKLLRLAEQAGAHEETQAAAIAFLQKRLTGHSFGAARAAMILAQHHYERGNLDAAFNLLATYVTDESQLLEVASWFANQPERACTLIQKAIEDCIANKNKRAYQRAAKLLDKLARPQFAVLAPDAFDTFLVTLRATHKAKRSFLAVLEAKGM